MKQIVYKHIYLHNQAINYYIIISNCHYFTEKKNRVPSLVVRTLFEPLIIWCLLSSEINQPRRNPHNAHLLLINLPNYANTMIFNSNVCLKLVGHFTRIDAPQPASSAKAKQRC